MTNDLDKAALATAEGNERVPAPQSDAPVNPWAEAFDALAKPAAEPASGDTPEATPGSDVAAGDTGAAGNVHTEEEHAPVGSVDAGGSGIDPEGSDLSGGSTGVGDVSEVLTKYSADIEERAIMETARMFLDREDDQGRKLIRQTDGKLGATINDPDIYRVDPNSGAATFYNPDTGRPFTGDNPRAQAKAWVEDYNDELRDTFNNIAAQQQARLEAEMAPVVELLKFVPTYEGLDNTRQQMLDALIEDYEVLDEAGDVIGYSVDLNKALAQVNKQVAALQASRPAPTGPAIDMPASGSGNANSGKEFTSLAEAMEAQQQAQLDKLRNR